MAVCPTKNIDRFEWFCEKATELGVDVITPIIGERSERRVFKPERCRKIVLSAMKQSLKAKLPTVLDAVPLKDFLSHEVPGLKLICYCFEGDARRESITDVLNEFATGFNGIDSADATGATGYIGSSDAASDASADASTTAGHCPETLDEPKITILIGPEGDFSPEEANLAVSQGYIPVHLGPSRLRTILQNPNGHPTPPPTSILQNSNGHPTPPPTSILQNPNGHPTPPSRLLPFCKTLTDTQHRPAAYANFRNTIICG